MPIAHPRRHPDWSVLDLADGSMLLLRSDGRNLRIPDPPPSICDLLRALDGRPWAELLAAVGVEPESERAHELIGAVEQLAEVGVVLDARPAEVPSWATPELVERFSLQVASFETLGVEGGGWPAFERLRNARVALLGAGGGVGSGAAMLLAAAGVGTLVLIDGDVVEPSNLTRQIFFDTAELGRPKVDALRRRVEAFSPFTEIETIASYVEGPQSARDILGACRADILLTCADRPRVRLARWVNEACVALQLPYLALYQGRMGPLYAPGRSACLACCEAAARRRHPYYDLMLDALTRVEPERRPSSPLGVLGAATAQVRECVGYLTGAWKTRSLGGSVGLDRTDGELEPIAVDPECSVCAPGRERAVA